MNTAPASLRRPRLDARDLARIATLAAVIAVLGLPGAIAVPALSVPITAQTLGVMLAGSLLGARRGAAAVLVFLVLVAAGLPLLSGGRGGLSVFAGSSAGFLVGWVLGAFVIGALVERRPQRGVTGWVALANVVGGIGVIYAVGIPGIAWIGGVDLATAATGSLAFVPGDLVKVAVATVVTAAVLRGYPPAAPPRRSRTRDTVPA